jgi:hypothetical protein
MAIYIPCGGEKKGEQDWAALILLMAEFRVGVFNHVGMIPLMLKKYYCKDNEIMTVCLIFLFPSGKVKF